MLGGRDWDLVRRNVLAAPNWAALARMRASTRRPSRRRGAISPAAASTRGRRGVRTPRASSARRLHSHHDLLTVNEVFCREDYAAGPEDPHGRRRRLEHRHLRLVLPDAQPDRARALPRARAAQRRAAAREPRRLRRSLHDRGGRRRRHRRRGRLRRRGLRALRRDRRRRRAHDPGAGARRSPRCSTRAARPGRRDRRAEDRHRGRRAAHGGGDPSRPARARPDDLLRVATEQAHAATRLRGGAPTAPATRCEWSTAFKGGGRLTARRSRPRSAASCRSTAARRWP